MEYDLNISENERQPQFFRKWQTFSFFQKIEEWKDLRMEYNIC
jgi:hypothetical protein